MIISCSLTQLVKDESGRVRIFVRDTQAFRNGYCEEHGTKTKKPHETYLLHDEIPLGTYISSSSSTPNYVKHSVLYKYLVPGKI